MLPCILRVLLVSVIVSQSFGCKSVDIREIEWGHHISVDEEGQARGHVKNAEQDNYIYKNQLEDKEFQTQYIDPIIENLDQYVLKQKNEARLPAQILIFIHGGLNSYKEGLGHIQEFLVNQKNTKGFPNLSSHFLISLNWEAGLRSALFDHFVQIRFGERSPVFAWSTLPIVLLHDFGESIVKTPDAIYSEAKDLFQNQSVNVTSATLNTALLASGYGLPIAAAHPALTIAGVMPYATYATAGAYVPQYIAEDTTRYLFWPIRMASAPFIEGFGTPAWDMLKRRPDLMLFNPTTQKDGAMGAVLKKLADKIVSGKWQTKECEHSRDKCPPVELTLLGHSMGAMVSDRILTTLSEKLTFTHIVYMGAANSIADFKVSVVPYLRNHTETHFWSFTLSEVNESNETYAADLLSRGSLLVWVDLLFERTYGLPQKRFGREVNQEWVNIEDKDIWQRTCRISFSDSHTRKEEPKKHGDFTNPEMVELVLGMVKNGCPEPVDIRKDPQDTRSDDEFRKDLQQRLENVPRFSSNSVAGIADNAPYMDKGDLTDKQFGDTHFLSEQSYKDIGGYFFPININAATVDELALLLRGDRYLAKQIFEQTCKTQYLSIQEMERAIPDLVSTGASELIMKHGTFGEQRPSLDDSWFPGLNLKTLFFGHSPEDLPKDSSTCVPSGQWPSIRHHLRQWTSRLRIAPITSHQSRVLYNLSKTRKSSDRYREEVRSTIKEQPTFRVFPVEKTSTPWDAILDIQGQRVAIKVHTWATLESEHALWRYDLKSPKPDTAETLKKRAEKFVDGIKRQADETNAHLVIFVTYEDVFSKPSMAQVKEILQKELAGKFYSVHGLPKTIPDKIKSVLKRHTKERVS